MTIVEFIEQMLAADEGDADRVHDIDCSIHPGFADERGDCTCTDPARVLAQVAAMRQVIRQAEMLAEYVDATREHEAYRYEPTLHRLLAPLASIWRDHEDYDPAWSPTAA